MNIAIIGAGAMGSIFGAMLSSVARVRLYDTWQEHVKAINEKGLRLVSGSSEQVKIFHIPAAKVPSEAEPKADLAMIFTKAFHTGDATRAAMKLLKPDGIILTLQNGIGNLEVIQRIYGRSDKVIAGVTSHGGTVLGPGEIRHAGQGPTWVAPIPGRPDLSTKLVETFQQAGIEVEIAQNPDSLIWGKLIVNVGINALAAICRVPNGILATTPECSQIMEMAVNEAVAVAHALNIELPYANPFEHVKQVCQLTASNRASMLQDILKGNPTEIDVINQAIVEKGQSLGIPTPTNQFLVVMIKALEATSQHRI